MPEKVSFIEPLLDKFEEYGKANIELFRLQTTEKIATYIASLFYRGIVFFLLLMFLLIANVGASMWIGELLGKSYYGFFCVAGFYAIVLGIVALLLRQSIKKAAGNSLVSEILK